MPDGGGHETTEPRKDGSDGIASNALTQLSHEKFMKIAMPGEESNGLIAVLAVGTTLEAQAVCMQKDIVLEAPSLLIVDVRNDHGKRWLGRHKIPEDAVIAIIDPLALKADKKDDDEDEAPIVRGAQFMRAGETRRFGRNIESCKELFDGTRSMMVSSAHLMIKTDDDGSVSLKDGGSEGSSSTNGTTISTGEYARAAASEIGARHEHLMHFREILGEEAVEQAVEVVGDTIPRSRLRELQELERNVIGQAIGRIEKILGQNKKGGGELGRLLRDLGEDPAQIREALARLSNEDEARRSIRGALEVRARQLKGSVFKDFHEDERKRIRNPAHNHPVDADGKMDSLDYVASLALAMLDGSFVDDESALKGFDVVKNDERHRSAALKLLESFARQQDVEKIIIDPTSKVGEMRTFIQRHEEALRGLAYPFRDTMERLSDTMRGASRGEPIDVRTLNEAANNSQQEWRILSSMQEAITEINNKIAQLLNDEELTVAEKNNADTIQQTCMAAQKTLENAMNNFRATQQYLGELRDPHWGHNATAGQLKLVVDKMRSDLEQCEVLLRKAYVERA